MVSVAPTRRRKLTEKQLERAKFVHGQIVDAFTGLDELHGRMDADLDLYNLVKYKPDVQLTGLTDGDAYTTNRPRLLAKKIIAFIANTKPTFRVPDALTQEVAVREANDNLEDLAVGIFGNAGRRLRKKRKPQILPQLAAFSTVRDGDVILKALLRKRPNGETMEDILPLDPRYLLIWQGDEELLGGAFRILMTRSKIQEMYPDSNIAFKDSDYALLVGARPRGPGMERKDLLEANAAIFSVQGRAMNDHANSDIKVLVVGNPANTNALIASSNAPDIDPRNFTAMTRLDHNRAMAQLAAKTDSHVNDIRCMTIWGNHSATQYPDLRHASVAGKNAADLVEQEWLVDEFIPTVQQRGAEIIAARGASSAASAASAAIDHMRDWALGTPDGDWVSMAVPADGSYGIEAGIIYSHPVRCSSGKYEIVQGLAIDDFSRARMAATESELREERAAVEELL